jgi:hypothetical protein
MHFVLNGSAKVTIPRSRSLSTTTFADKFANPTLAPKGVEVLSIAAKKQARRAGDVNPPVTVRARGTSAAAGSHQGPYRPIDIDRSPCIIGPRRVNGNLGIQDI